MSAVARERLARWIAAYRPDPGLPDELVGADGFHRGAWPGFLDALARLDESDIMARFVSAERHIRDAGISYR
ncbi:hypothetical protein, partial [Escherichia coli]